MKKFNFIFYPCKKNTFYEVYTWFWHVFQFLNVFVFKHILPLQRSRGLKTRFFAFVRFLPTFTVASAGIVDLQLEFQTQGSTKYKHTTTFHYRHAHFWPFILRLFKKPSTADWQIYAWKTAKKCCFFIHFLGFFHVRKPLWWCHWLQIRFPAQKIPKNTKQRTPHDDR